ncbi:chymotrypsin inhibitor-like [Cataglyphis hispanica]|uniref:chymotrypsin inhibitor-like n=1 Tax=Cataglyphis hispanica TaxID=1086592 RepID=UPI00217F4BD6|nr:chymotrypsin inhibitor-like [Cataglyphis hispanica]
MSRTIFCLLVVVVVLSTVWGNPPKKCGKNEIWTECGSACPPKCNPPKEPQACIALCVKGCACKPGYLRNKHNECVRPCDCKC